LFGYAGKILYIDLNSKKSKVVRMPKLFYEKYIGGNGLAIRLLYDNNEANIDPFSPENTLVFAVGPFAGTPIPTSGKYIVQAKSPLTNIMGESISSGLWGQTMRRTGYDAFVIKGRMKKPTYLFVDDDTVSFKDAENLWGQDSIETSDSIVEELSDENICVASIGPGGERLVKYATITNDRYRQAGRTGMGAVMGAKNLKAVAVRGTKNVEVANLEKLLEVTNELYKQCQGEITTGYRAYGTPQSVMVHNYIAALPTRNWQESSFELAEKIGAEYIGKKYIAKAVACSGCPIACDHISIIKEGPYKGLAASVEFESIYSLGSQCGIGHFPTIVKAVDLCDRLGIDTISAGVTIGWAMECFEKGILNKKDTDGLDLSFGNQEALLEVINKIAYRKGIGNLLAEGVKEASEKVGKNSEHFAMHNKGLELPGYDLRGLKACALGFMTSTRGGCHLRTSIYDFDLRGKIDRFKADPVIGKLVMEREDLYAIVESAMLCKFIRGLLGNFDKIAEIYTLVTGIEMPPEKLQKAGERIYNLEKAFNVREGWTKKDEYPPPRIMKDPIKEEAAKGQLIPKAEFELMLNAYFKARGWSAEGIPRKQKLNELGLEKIAKEIGV
jgi:aldehyde:ferredoxin oxidoreductase